jgi:DNA polymerase I
MRREIFARVAVLDFEYEVSPGDLPRVLCLVVHLLDEQLRHVGTIRRWRGEFGSEPPFDIGSDTLVVGYSLWAEMTCFLVLGWNLPVHVFDLHTCYQATTNILLPHAPNEQRQKPRRRLSDACRRYGIDGWERIDKEVIAKDIGEGRWRQYGCEAVFAYCEEDVRASAELLRRQLCGAPGLPPADVPRVLHWSNYSAKAVAQIQARGMLIDVSLWEAVQEHKYAIIRELLRRFDPSHGEEETIYTPDGHWEYARFERFLVRHRVSAWPRLPSGQLDTDSDAFRLMYGAPGIEGLHALRDVLRVIVNARLPIGRDGRNRPSLFPFSTATGRNAHAKSLFNAHASMRSFIRFPPNKIGLYLDWRTQEPAIAAVLSGDEALMAAYRRGDIYHAFAFDAGLTTDPDPKNWKKNEPALRQRIKALQLGVNYGMGVPALAKGLDRHPVIASYLIEKHRRMYPVMWQWRDDYVQQAMLARRAESMYGWPLHISTSPNLRTLFNFPMQSGGAEMLRHAACQLCEAGIVPLMLVHDGILFEIDNDEQAELARNVMYAAGVEVCGGFEVGVDVDKRMVNGERYRDGRPVAARMWKTVTDTLAAVRSRKSVA